MKRISRDLFVIVPVVVLVVILFGYVITALAALVTSGAQVGL